MNLKRNIFITAVLVMMLIFTSCGKDEKVLVFSAASLTESMGEINSVLGDGMTLNLDSSTRLRIQIENGAEADIYISANEKNYNLLNEGGFVEKGSGILENKMVLITPKGNEKVKSLEDLTGDVSIILAAEEVPAGKYARNILAKYEENGVEGYAEKALSNVVSNESTVKSVASKIALGEADAGLVYVTDVTEATRNKVSMYEIEDEYNEKATYWVALLKDSKNKNAAKMYDELLSNEDVKAVFGKYGFKVVY
ncbi:molybdate transport system substrate-binding protein [Dethiosulfatibacter aminovorans DSM 17477]|uniref:Molybdate transport system substrate-binding protein n=1 Tax=Dethiosulfatibacter aminovorans DSM 17477 TaxID=1121476 RepID=A0A1M6LJH0_9FIRM|nr:molybdate ABC transporter substrate-binding protein [Dethiosulfatibacter aminovorans]SHJ71310.1 molybdate transport system substrate-binding protein [Dethiosulfatibacter aminovorans DSM 17477]